MRPTITGLHADASIVPLSPTVGAEVRCGPLPSIGREDTERLLAALRDHLVVLIRRQSLSDPELIAFGRRLGELDFAPLAYTGNQSERRHPEVIIISNVKEGGVPIGVLGDGEVVWHSDNSYRETPLSYSLLYSVVLPESGGETGFTNMYRAYETLPAALKERIEGLEIKHDMTYNSAGELRRGFTHVSDPVAAPGPRHPIVRTHPETGRRALYLGRRPNAYVCGLAVADSEALLDALWSHATQQAHAWYHRWQVGDVLIWDNRCVMHRRNPFDPSARRILRRLQFKGERPIAAERVSHENQ
jgi:taurine dioxygenase